jgi:hypothetical protein
VRADEAANARAFETRLVAPSPYGIAYCTEDVMPGERIQSVAQLRLPFANRFQERLNGRGDKVVELQCPLWLGRVEIAVVVDFAGRVVMGLRVQFFRADKMAVNSSRIDELSFPRNNEFHSKPPLK